MSSLKHFFAEIEPPERLLLAIMRRIQTTARRRARLTFVLLGSAAITSGGVLIAALGYASQEFYASGFYDFVSLLFTDAAARSHWQEIMLSLATTLPSFALLAILICAGILSWSLINLPQATRSALRLA